MLKEVLKISEFAALSGISRKLLIFYDNNGILHPHAVDRDNGYRYYSYRQIDAASVITSLRQAGMSLDGIREYLKGKSPQNLIETLEERVETLEQQILGLMRIKNMIRSRIEQTNRGIAEDVGLIRVERQPAENIFLGPELADDYDVTDGWKDLPDFYAECRRNDIQLGFTVGTMVSRGNLERRRWGKRSHYFYRLPHGQYPVFFTKPEGDYVVGSEYADYGYVESLYRKLAQFMEINQLQFAGNAYEEYLIDEISEEDPEKYLLQIAVQVSV